MIEESVILAAGFETWEVGVLRARHPDWDKTRDRFLIGKRCALCGRKENLQAHHELPFHLFPDRELDESNLVPLCTGGPWNCHFLAGHLGKSWSVYAKDPRAVIARFREFLSALSIEAG